MPVAHPAELGTTRLFSGADAATLARVIEGCPVVEIAAGEVLIERGRDNDTVYLVLDGQLEVHLVAPQEPPFVDVGIGDCVGEMSIIDGHHTSAYVTAKLQSRLLAIPREMLWSLIHDSHAVARNLLYTLSRRVRFGNDALKSSASTQIELESMAFVDALTGLHNRRWLDQAFRRQLENDRRHGRRPVLMMVDIDHFKRYNDSYGHLAGDKSIVRVARVLAENLRPQDLLARFGGEEFSILLPDIEPAEAGVIAERLRQAVERDGGDEAPELASELLERADAALYDAKKAGRNCIRTA
jgi:GGDEF domain-containing protein